MTDSQPSRIIVRYLFAVAVVAATFALGMWLIPITGNVGPFALFFAGLLVISLVAGVGPGICAVLLGLPLATYTLVTRAGYPPFQAAIQALLDAIDGMGVVYLTFLLQKGRQAAHDSNRQLREANDEITRSMARTREVIELAPDAFFQAELSARLTDVNQAACRLLGYERDELISKALVDIIPPEDVPRLAATRESLLAPGGVERGDWTLLSKDGTQIPVEVSTNILPDGRWQAFVRDSRSRKRIERSLQESEQRLNLALDSGQVGMWDLDLLTDTSVRSLRHDQIFGYSSPIPEWGQAIFMTHVVPEDRDAAQHAFERAFATDHFDMECRIRWADTSIHWISALGRVYRNATGRPVRMMGTIMDITERKRIDEELRAAKASLDAIIDNIPLMLFIKDSASLRFRRFNHAAEDLLGRAKETLIGKSDYDLWPPEQARFFVAKDREALNSGKIVDIPEEPIQTPHEGVRLLHTKKVPILDGAGHPMYLLGISEDITERRRIEKEQQFLAEAGVVLSASLDYEQTLASLAQFVVQHVADWCGVDVVDEQGELQRMRVASADPAKAVLSAILEQMPPDRGLPHVMRSVIESKQPLVKEHVTPAYLESVAQGPEHLKVLLATGVTSLVVVPLLLRGEPLGAMALGSSTPSRVYGQDDLRLAEALADRASIAIENCRLYRASVQAAELRDQVLGVVAHDLRNPLSTILLQAGALTRRDPGAERRSQKQTESIRRAAVHMDRLIQDLLDVARMESSHLTIERAPVSARELIFGAVEMLRPLASSSSLELGVDLDPEVPDVWGDRDRLLQVFQNLIGNAIKFTDAGGSITVSAASNDHEVVFGVADTGVGIAPEDLPRVFDRFWQATRAGQQGAGLGLPITKGIVESHGGRIWVDSSEGRGTTFFFTIPTVPRSSPTE